MTIYLSKNYRKIWEHFNGPIPKDEDGRTYEIHHIDGNHSNNHIDNLQCVSIQEHYDIHYKQEDWGACWSITSRINTDPEIISKMSSEAMKKRVEDGTHHFIGGDIQRKRIEDGTHHLLGGDIQKRSSRKRVKDGTHNFLNSDLQRNTQLKRVADGTHNFLGGEIQRNLAKRLLEEGKHYFQNKPKIECPHCGKVLDISNAKRWHFDKCKHKMEQ